MRTEVLPSFQNASSRESRSSREEVMSLLLSGTDIKPGGTNAPTLYEIGYSLCQVPRFVGHTRVPWSVLQHSYAVAAFARFLDWTYRLQFLALMHDAHESVIGDIPTGWKT